MKYLAVTLTAFLLASAAWMLPVQAEEAKVYTMSGRIDAIDSDTDTVVVEVPVEGEETRTIGGPVIDEAALHKDGREVDLDAFDVGDWVEVTWEKTQETHVIHKLAAK
jgi:hypothetical protein